MQTVIGLRAQALALICGLVMALAGCAATPSDDARTEFQNERSRQSRVDEINTQLALQSSLARQTAPEHESYRLGADDLLEVRVFNVPELQTEVRVAGDGSITLPLIGTTPVAGLTLSDAEQLIAARLEVSYVRNPQVTVLVKDYRSRQITVVGAVKAPQMYAVQRRLTLVDALAMAGGLDKEAGSTAYVVDEVTEPETGQAVRRSLVIDLEQLMRGDPALNVMLGESAVINVPKAGVVYVEGAVEKPGVYPLQSGTTVLKAVTMAGGLKFQAKRSSIRVVRAQAGDESQPIAVDFDFVRTHPEADVRVADGDVVVVENDLLKTSVGGVLKGLRGLFSLGYAL